VVDNERSFLRRYRPPTSRIGGGLLTDSEFCCGTFQIANPAVINVPDSGAGSLYPSPLFVSDLVGLHMVHYQDEWSDRAVRRFIHRSGEYLERLLALVEADSASLRLRKNKIREVRSLRRRVDLVKSDMSGPGSPLSGRQIMEILDIGPGLIVGRAKNVLIDAVVDGDIPASEDAAREYLLKWWKGAAGIFGLILRRL